MAERSAAHSRAIPEVSAVARDDPGFPPGLLDLDDVPERVFVAGALPIAGPAVAIVGSRAATPYGIAQARRLAADLARLGIVIVSGLARGIDAAAHRGALEVDGRTIAVLPGSLLAIAPRHHHELAATIAGAGALLSEIERGTSLQRGMFIRRNRLIAAMSRATVVVEAAERSGALSTAAAARRLGRPVLAVPGDVDRPTARGCHALIRGGARLCESAADVLAVLGDDASSAVTPEARLITALGPRPRTVDAIASAAGLGVDDTLAGLLRLEWSGGAVAHPGSRWSRSVS